MKLDEMILQVRTPVDWDNTKFIEDIANKRPISFTGCKISLIEDILASFTDEIAERLIHGGLSNLLRSQLLTEALVQPGQTKNFVEELMVKFLQDIKVNGELIIVDPYFFAHTMDSTYPQLIEGIIQPFQQHLSSIKIVTFPSKVDASLKQLIDKKLNALNPSIQIKHSTSPDYHDRFWISDNRSKGILTGSSLNGLGKRYAVIDKLSSNDVVDIVNSLEKNNLI